MRSTRLKHVASVIAGQSPASDEMEPLSDGLPFLQGNAEFGREHPQPVHQCGTAPKRARADDVLVSVRAPVGAVNVADQAYGIGRGLAAVRPRWIDQRYLRWLLECSAEVLRREATGSTFEAISASDLANLQVPLSDKEHQRAIADFLDRETVKIDALIEKQNALIDGLRERQLAARTEVLGLSDPSIRQTASIPLSTVFREIDLRSSDGSGELLSVSHLTGVTPRAEKNVTMFEAESTVGYKIVEPHDLVINTMWAWMGALGFAPLSGIVSPAYNVYRFRDPNDHDVDFWTAYLGSPSFVSWMAANSTGIVSSRLRLYPDAFLRLRVLSPSLGEQRLRSRIVRECNARIEALVNKAQRFVSLARERRSALITAAVTGQIDVSKETAA